MLTHTHWYTRGLAAGQEDRQIIKALPALTVAALADEYARSVARGAAQRAAAAAGYMAGWGQ